MNEVKTPLQQRHEAEIPEDTSKLPRLENWFLAGPLAYGDVYNHPRLQDGLFVHTSIVRWIRTDLKLLQTKNTLYSLEKETE